MKKCPHCGEQTPDEAVVCEHCNYVIDAELPRYPEMKRDHALVQERLPILSTLAQACADVARQWKPLLRALLVPAVLSSLLLSIAANPANTEIVVWPMIVLLIVFAVFAVSCHRIVLLGEQSLPNPWGVYFTMRELRFASWLLGIVFTGFFASVPFIVILLFLVGAAGGWEGLLPQTWGSYSVFIAVLAFMAASLALVAGYVCARTSLVLPATAVDQRMRLREAWALSRGNGWRLTATLIVPAVVVVLLPRSVSNLVVVPQAILSAMLLFLSAIFLSLIPGMVGIAVLSVAFRRLSGGPVPIAGPPVGEPVSTLSAAPRTGWIRRYLLPASGVIGLVLVVSVLAAIQLNLFQTPDRQSEGSAAQDPGILTGAGLLQKTILFEGVALGRVGSITVGQFGPDPQVEALIGTDRGIAFVTAEGVVRSFVSFDRKVGTAVPIDVNGDGVYEFLDRGGGWQPVALFDHQGTTIWRYSGGGAAQAQLDPGGREAIYDVVAGDLDQDGTLEFVVGAMEALHLLDDQGVRQWTREASIVTDVAVVDTDGDGQPEIVYGNGGYDGRGIWILDARGEVVRRLSLGFEGFTLVPWPDSPSGLVLLKTSRDGGRRDQGSFRLVDFNGETVAEFETGTLAQMAEIQASPVQFEGTQRYVAVVGGFTGTEPRSGLWVFGPDGELVYSEVLPFRNPRLGILPAGTFGEQILVAATTFDRGVALLKYRFMDTQLVAHDEDLAVVASADGTGAVSRSSIDAATAQFAGTWRNRDPNTLGLTRLEITASGGQLVVHAWADCTPQDCDWGTETGTILGSSASITWDQGFVRRQMALTLEDPEELRATLDSVYSDNRGRQQFGDVFVRSR